MIRRMKNGDMVQPSNLEKDNYQIKEDGIFISDSQRERYNKIKKATEFNEKVKHNSKKHGGFTFLRIENALTEINPATVGRLAYLSTYMEYGNQLLVRSKNRPMLKSDLPDVLLISRDTANKFYNESKNAGLIEDHGSEGLYMNEVFFRDQTTDKNQIRLYRKTIQQLYKKTFPKYIKNFGYVVQLVSYINKEWNIISHNPLEKDSNKVQIMTMKELCEAIDYDYSHISRLNEALFGLAFDWNGRKQALCASIEFTTEEGKQKGLIVNPHLVFAGTDFKKVEGYGMFFRPRKTKTIMQYDEKSETA